MLLQSKLTVDSHKAFFNILMNEPRLHLLFLAALYSGKYTSAHLYLRYHKELRISVLEVPLLGWTSTVIFRQPGQTLSQSQVWSYRLVVTETSMHIGNWTIFIPHPQLKKLTDAFAISLERIFRDGMPTNSYAHLRQEIINEVERQ